jgi:hypothetical protein
MLRSRGNDRGEIWVYRQRHLLAGLARHAPNPAVANGILPQRKHVSLSQAGEHRERDWQHELDW